MTTSLVQSTTQEDSITYSLAAYQPPNVKDLIQSVSTARIWRHPTRPGVVVQSPVKCCWESIEPEALSLQHKFCNEMQICEVLGDHLRVLP